MCTHKLSSIKSLFASGPFKFQCQECGSLVYREHRKAVLLWHILFIDRIGLLFFAVVFVVFAYLPLATLVFLTICAALYLIDVAHEPLKEFTENQAQEQGRKNKIILGVVLVIIAIGVGSYLW